MPSAGPHSTVGFNAVRSRPTLAVNCDDVGLRGFEPELLARHSPAASLYSNNSVAGAAADGQCLGARLEQCVLQRRRRRRIIHHEGEGLGRVRDVLRDRVPTGCRARREILQTPTLEDRATCAENRRHHGVLDDDVLLGACRHERRRFNFEWRGCGLGRGGLRGPGSLGTGWGRRHLLLSWRRLLHRGKQRLPPVNHEEATALSARRNSLLH